MKTVEQEQVLTPDRLGLLPSDYVQAHPVGVDDDYVARVRDSFGARHKRDILKQVKFSSEWRDESLARNQFLDQMGITKLIPEEVVNRLLEEGKLYGIPDHDRILYPTYQFDPATRLPYPVMQRMIAMCRGASPWEIHAFAELPMVSLEGHSTSEALYGDEVWLGIEQLEQFVEQYGPK